MNSRGWKAVTILAAGIAISVLVAAGVAPVQAAPPVPEPAVQAVVELPPPDGVKSPGYWMPFVDTRDCGTAAPRWGFPQDCEGETAWVSEDGQVVTNAFTHWHTCLKAAYGGYGYTRGFAPVADNPCTTADGPLISHGNVIMGRAWVDRDRQPSAAGKPPVVTVDCFTAEVVTAGQEFTCSSVTQPTDVVFAWTWDCGNGQTGTESMVECRYRKPGEYTVTLRARGLYGVTEVQQRLTAAPAMRAGAQCSPMSGPAPLRVWCAGVTTVDAAAKVDWVWEVEGLDGPAVTGADPEFMLGRPAKYRVTAVATGPTGVATVPVGTITVVKALRADVACTPTSGPAPLTVACEGFATTQADWSWDAPSASNRTTNGKFFTATFTQPGSHEITAVASGGSQKVRPIVTKVRALEVQ